MVRLRSLTMLLTLVAIVAAASPADAEDGRHSGTVITIDRAAGALVVGEVGPWLVRQGETVITPRTVTITGDTAFVRIERRPETPSGFPGDFVEQGAERWAVQSGDFVTVETRREGFRLVATRVAVVVIPAR
jgi:hypothetical protein